MGICWLNIKIMFHQSFPVCGRKCQTGEKKFKARVLLIPTPPSQVEKSLGGKLPPDTIPCRSQYTQRQQPESIAPVVFGEGCVCTTLNTHFISSKFSNKLQYNNPMSLFCERWIILKLAIALNI